MRFVASKALGAIVATQRPPIGQKTRARVRGFALRPALEPMECRALLSTQPLIIATLGDSLTDEYQFYGAATPPPQSYPALLADESTTLPPEIYLTGRDAARNWVEEVGATLSSQLSLGDFTTSSRGMTRNQGYEENWAENGTTASGPDVSGTATTFAEEYKGIPPEFSLGEDPTPGLVTQTSANGIPIGDINVVTILIGANDYNAALSAYSEQSNKLDASVFDTANTSIENAISTAISTIQAAAAAAGNTSLKFVVITTPNITVAPLIQDEAGSSLPALKVIIGEKIDALDANLFATYHGNPDVGLIDSTAIIDAFIENPVIDGVTVNMEAGGQDYTDGFTGDGFHPGTIVQGLITQAVVSTINELEGAQVVTPVTDADIVDYAEESQPSIAFSTSTSAATAVVGQAITFQAHLTPAPGGEAIPTGTVSFEPIIPAIGSAPARPGPILGTVPLYPNGNATLVVKNLPLGTYTIAALYNGDRNTDARLSSTIEQTVRIGPPPKQATTTQVDAAEFVARGTVWVQFTVIVAPLDPPASMPTGSVQLSLGSYRVVKLPLQAGTARMRVRLAAVARHHVSAYYAGNTKLYGSGSPFRKIGRWSGP
jgi:phospholipase/lecithinase/hemolysin